MSDAAPRRLVELQILRAVAASLVVVNHGVIELGSEGVAGAAPYSLAANLVGHYGVSAFFVLSGFLMTRLSMERFGVKGAAGRFLWERLVRIAPLYWIATLLTYWKLMDWNPALRIKRQLGLSLLFVPNFLSGAGTMYPVLVQGWTLNFEMFFYVAFAACLLLPRGWGLGVLVGGMGLLSEPWAAHWVTARWGILAYYCSPLLRLFMAGVLMAVVERVWGWPKIRMVVPAWVLVCLPAGVALGLAGWSGLAGGWQWAHFLGMVAMGICLIARESRLGWWERGLVKLGDASYATYLFHIFAVLQVGYWAGLFRLPWGVTVGLMVVAANGLGLAVHWAVERPMTRGLKRLMLRRMG